jgi:hypothetical protein
LELETELQPALKISQETPLIVYALLAAILMLIGITATSSLDFSNGKRR